MKVSDSVQRLVEMMETELGISMDIVLVQKRVLKWALH